MFDKQAARLYLVAHENGKGFVGGFGVAQLYAEHETGVGIHGGFPELFAVHLTETFVALDFRLALNRGKNLVALNIGISVFVFLALGDTVERRLRDIHVTGFNQGLHIAEKEGQQERADMGAVNVGIRHDDNLVVAELFEVKFVADTGTQRGDDRHELVVAVNTVDTRLLHIQHFTPERKNRLDSSVSAALGGAACGVTLDDEDFGFAAVARLAVSQLAGQLRGFERRLSADALSRLSSRFTRSGGSEGLFKNCLGDGGIFLQIDHQLVADELVYHCAHLGVAELCLGLSFKLRFLELDADNRGQAFAHVLAAEILVVVL